MTDLRAYYDNVATYTYTKYEITRDMTVGSVWRCVCIILEYQQMDELQSTLPAKDALYHAREV